MTETEIDRFNTVLTFEEDYVTGTPPRMAGPAGAEEDADIARLKMLLRPVIIDILRDELDLDLRMGG